MAFTVKLVWQKVEGTFVAFCSRLLDLFDCFHHLHFISCTACLSVWTHWPGNRGKLVSARHSHAVTLLQITGFDWSKTDGNAVQCEFAIRQRPITTTTDTAITLSSGHHLQSLSTTRTLCNKRRRRENYSASQPATIWSHTLKQAASEAVMER